MDHKVMVRSGETDQAAIDKFGPTFIGHLWDARLDLLKFKPAVNLSNRRRKLKTEDDITPDNMHLIDDATLTLRIIVGILAAIYDPLGLISALTVCWKIQLSLLHQKGIGWDDPLSGETEVIWKDILRSMVLLPEIVFHRSAQPHETTGEPGVVIFSDGGKPASAGAVYLRWKKLKADEDGGTYESRILAAKARIGRHSIPRQELNALVIVCRLLTALWNGFAKNPEYVVVLVDSTCTISSLECDQRILAPFFSSRCAEVLDHISL